MTARIFRSGLAAAAAGALLTALVSTLGDVIWFTWIPAHVPAYGLMHGTLLFLWVGLYCGLLARRPATGAAGGALIGFLAAGGYYLLAPVLGYVAMFVLWIGLWVMLGILNSQILRRGATREAVVRGAVAALASGLAFYAISGIWLSPPANGRNYGWHFVAWTIAYLPAFAALLAPAPRALTRSA
jgi:hypothetical protein